MPDQPTALSTALAKLRRFGIRGFLKALSRRLPYAVPYAKTLAARWLHGPARRKTLWIHIGPHKTGTTLLQHILVEERHSLQAFSIWFDEASTDFGEYLSGFSPLPEADLSLRIQRLRERYQQRPEDVMILSSEFFFGNPDSAYANIGAIARDLKALTGDFDVKIIACIRRQDEFIQSWYHQYVKRGGAESFEEYGRKVGLDRFRWDELLAAYEEHFGREAMRVMLYEKVTGSGSLLDGFFKGLGQEFDIREREYPRFNPSFSEKGLTLALLCYPHLDPQERKVLRNFLLEHFPKRPGEKFNLLSEEQRRALMQTYRESNRRCFEHYLGSADEAAALGYEG